MYTQESSPNSRNWTILGVWFTTILTKIIDWPQPGSDFEVQRSPARLVRCVNWWSLLLDQLGSKTSRYWTLKVERGFHRICLEGFPWDHHSKNPKTQTLHVRKVYGPGTIVMLSNLRLRDVPRFLVVSFWPNKTGDYPLNMAIESSWIYPLIAWWIFPVRYVSRYQRVHPSFYGNIKYWVNYNDLTATSLESWLIEEIIPFYGLNSGTPIIFLWFSYGFPIILWEQK